MSTRNLLKQCRWLVITCAAAIVWGQESQADVVALLAKSAQQAQRAGDFRTAIRDYSKLTQLMPNVAEVYSNLGIAYFFADQRTEALSAFSKALKLKPELASALIFSGIVYYDTSDFKRAAQMLERGTALSAADPLAHTWLGFTYSATEQLDKAREQFSQAVALQPDNIDALYGLGNANVEIGRLRARELAEAAPDGARIWQLAGDLWRSQGDEKKAELYYTEAAKRESSPKENDLFQAATEAREAAQKAFGKISTIAPDSYRAHQIVADSLASQRRPREAIAEYRAALRQQPRLSGIHTAIADLFLSEGNAIDALTELQLEAERRPADPELQYRMGKALTVTGDYEAALKALEKSVASPTAPPAASKELAKIYLHRKENDRAATMLTAYLRQRPRDASAYYLRMRALKLIGNNEAAERDRIKFQELSKQKDASSQQALSFLKGLEDTVER